MLERTCNVVNWDQDCGQEESDADAESKRAAFEARRKAHYNMAEALRAARSESRGEPEDSGGGDGAGGGRGGGELEEDAVNGGVGTAAAVRRRRQRRRVARGEEGEEESSGESSGDGAEAAAESGENDTMEQSNGEMR